MKPADFPEFKLGVHYCGSFPRYCLAAAIQADNMDWLGYIIELGWIWPTCDTLGMEGHKIRQRAVEAGSLRCAALLGSRGYPFT